MTQKQKIFSIFFIGLIALALLLAADLPRFLALAPPLAGIFGMLGLYIMTKQKPVWSKTPLLFVLPLLALGALSTVWAIDPAESLERTAKLAAIMIPSTLLLVIAANVKIEWLRSAAWLIPASILAGAALISVELFFDAPFHRIFRGTAETAPVYDAVFNRGATTYAICLAPALAISCAYIKPKIAYAAFAIIFTAMALSTESQSAQLALLLTLLFMFTFPYSRKPVWIALAAMTSILIASAPFLATWMFNNLAEPLAATPFLQQGYAGPRLEIWDYVSRYALQKPLTGYGLEASRVITDFDSAQKYQEGTSILHPHNFALQLWLEFGIIGAGTGIAFCLGILRLISRLTYAHARVALPVFIAILSVASTGYGLWQSWWIGLIFIATALCIIATRLKGANDA